MSDKAKYIIPLIVAGCITAGLYMGKFLYEKPAVNQTTQSQTNKIMSVIDLIQSEYVDTVNEAKLVDQTITEMLAKLDPHSAYIPPVYVDQARESIEGRFEGIGVRFMIHRDTLSVTHVLPNSPSERADLHRGDRIIKVDTSHIASIGLTNTDVMGLLKGKAGSKVKLNVLRNGKVIEKIITRGQVARTSILSSQMLTKEVGYIKLSEFSMTSYDEFNSAIARLKRQGMKKLIFDLRNNGGGLLHIAIQMLDEFLGSGKLIVYTEGTHQPRQEQYATSFGNLHNLELAVLINENSASASEIVSGAIQDNDRGTIIGRRSYGKGLVQKPVRLKDGSELRLTVARYYTPTGRSIQKSYAGGFDAYHQESIDRYKNGELYNVDSTLFVDSLKFKTPKGKIVYGGGGIMPDVFIPLDTANYTNYLGELRMFDVFNHFGFDEANRTRTKWKSFQAFNKNFKVDVDLLNRFKNYASKNYKVRYREQEFQTSIEEIKNSIKSMVANHLFDENGFYNIILDQDVETQKALEILK